MNHQESNLLREKKILYLHKSGRGWGGAQQNLFDLINHFKNIFGQTIFVCNKSLLLEKIKVLPVKTYALPIRTVRSFPIAIIMLAMILLKEKPEILHSNHRYPTMLAHILRAILGLHFSILHTARSVFNSNTRIRLLGDRTIANSQAVQKNLLEKFHLPAEKIQVIYDGIQSNFRKSVSLNERNDPVFQMLNTTPKTIIGCIGTLVPAKGVDYLIKAIAQLPSSIQNRILVLIVGNGPLRKKLEAMVQEFELTEIIKFLGYQTDVFRILSYCNFVVIPSIQEGLPNVLFESYLLAKPVIASELDFVFETIIPHQIGLTFPVSDPQKLAEAIQHYVEHPDVVVEHGLAGQKFVVDWFSLDRNLKNYQLAYQELLERENP